MDASEIKLHEWYYFYSDWHKGIVAGQIKTLPQAPPLNKVTIDHVVQAGNHHPSWGPTAEFYADTLELICRFGDVCQTCGARLEGFLYEPLLVNLPTTESRL